MLAEAPVPPQPEQSLTPEEIQAEASRLAHARIEGSEPIDFSFARNDLQRKIDEERAKRDNPHEASMSKHERMEEMLEWSEAQGKITRERADAARESERVAKTELADATAHHKIDSIEKKFKDRSRMVSNMQHTIGSTMNTDIYGMPTKSGDIVRHEMPKLDATPTRVFGTPRRGPRKPLRSPANMGKDKH